jgi:hypothetical protein
MFLYTFEVRTLSSLFSSLNSEVVNAVFGVEVDQFNPNRLNNVKKIGFIAKVDAMGQLDFDVMDTIIQYRQIQAEVFLQIPHDFSMKPHDMLVMANSVKASVILMPPPIDADAATWAAWHETTLSYAEAMLNYHAFAKELLPVSSYVQYMVMRVAGHTPATLTDDPMMKHYFEDGMNVGVMDALKADLDAKILAHHGGAEAFESFVHGTLAGLYERVEERTGEITHNFIDWIDNCQLDHLGYVVTSVMNALGITDKPFLDLMIDMAGDAREANSSVIKTIRDQLSPAERDKIPGIYFEDSDVTIESLAEKSTLVYDFFSRVLPA